MAWRGRAGVKRLKQTYYIHSYEEMILFGESLATKLEGAIVGLLGDLGAGKTTLAKGIIRGMCGIPLANITSPTFQYAHFYSGKGKTVAHFDLWRLHDEREFLSLGLDEYLASGACLIEWPDRIHSLLPDTTCFIEAKVYEAGREVSIWSKETSR